MGYVNVKEESNDTLYLCREPSTKAWAILVGCTSLGLGAALYSYDYLIWKLAYIVGAIFVGVSCFENWEECIFDKKKKQVMIKSQNIFQKSFPTQFSTSTVAANLDELQSVTVSEEDVKYAGKGYIVVMHFESGIQLGITETAVIGDKSEPEMIAQKITKFTGIDNKSTLEHTDEKVFTEDIDIIPSSVVAQESPKEDKAVDINIEEKKVNLDLGDISTITNTASEEQPKQDTAIDVKETVALDSGDVPSIINLTAEEEKSTNTGNTEVYNVASITPTLPDTPESSSSDDDFEKIDKSTVENISEVKD